MSHFYFCTECKKSINEITEVLLVERSSHRGFCSEECILKFFSPLMKEIAKYHLNLKKELGLTGIDELNEVEVESLLNCGKFSPEEVWCAKNELGEEIFYYISQLENKDGHKLVSACLTFDENPSMMLYQFTTKSELLVEKFRIGVEIDLSKAGTKTSIDTNSKKSDGANEVEIDNSTHESLELKKSIYLSELLENRSESDIPFENFNLYDRYLKSTLEDPDEVYNHIDEENDEVMTYIKSYQQESLSFFYLVICMKVKDSMNEDELLLPVLSFPSLDGELYKLYKKGEPITAPLKN